jgi:hypothetical protein
MSLANRYLTPRRTFRTLDLGKALIAVKFFPRVINGFVTHHSQAGLLFWLLDFGGTCLAYISVNVMPWNWTFAGEGLKPGVQGPCVIDSAK